VPVPVVALVGYTNSGKSTLLNTLTHAGVFCEDKLFATLDPTTRRIQLPDGRRALVSDTVGFIRKLPHELVEAFKATLEEVSEADILLHVIDASHPKQIEQVEAVDKIMEELGLADKEVIHVFNKIDRFENKNIINVLLHQKPGSVAISALHNEGTEKLLSAVEEKLADNVIEVALSLPIREASLVSQIHELGKVEDTRYIDDHVEIRAILTYQTLARLEKSFPSLMENVGTVKRQKTKTQGKI
jgi:GTP-binding protein HflX